MEPQSRLALEATGFIPFLLLSGSSRKVLPLSPPSPTAAPSARALDPTRAAAEALFFAAEASARREAEHRAASDASAAAQAVAAAKTRGRLFFSLSQFAAQLPLQLLLPWSLPLYGLLYSPSAMLTVISSPNPPGWVVTPTMTAFILLVQVCPSLTLGAYLLAAAATPTMTIDMVHTMCALACTRLAVCIKYACLSPADYRARMHSWVASLENHDSQLITGWLHLTTATIHREVELVLTNGCAAGAAGAAFTLGHAALRQLCGGLCAEAREVVRSGVVLALEACEAGRGGGGGSSGSCCCPTTSRSQDGGGGGGGSSSSSSSSYCGVCDGSSSRSSRALPPAAPPPAPGHLTLPASVLVDALLVQANHDSTPFTVTGVRVMFAIAVLGTFASTAVRAQLGVPLLGHTALEGGVIVGHWLANLFVMGAVYSFLFLGAVTHRRMACALSQLGRLVSPAEDRVFVVPEEPVLPLGSHAHAHAFMVARTLLRAFGAAQHQRLVLLTSLFLLVFFLAAAYVLMALYHATPGVLGDALPPMVLLHTLVLPAIAAIAIKLREASRCNLESEHHELVVCNERVRLRLGVAQHPSTAHPALLLHLELLSDLERTIRAQHHLHPVSILGARAKMGLVSTFIGIFVSLETVCTTLFLTRIYGRV